jgi:alpha-L-arabinofuranosidase
MVRLRHLALFGRSLTCFAGVFMKLQDLFLAQKSRVWSMLYLGAVGLLFLAGFSGNAKPTWAQSGPTVINIGTTVQRSDVRRLGINIGGQTYYDSGQMLRDITFNNPGFEGEQWRSVLVCTAVSGTTCTDGNGWSQWPANFLQGGAYNFIYGNEKGQTGTLASMTAASGTGGAPAWYDFGTVKPSVGDTFIIQKSIPGLPATGYGWWPGTSGGATITADTTDLSPETPGVQAVSLNAGGSGQSANEISYFDSTAGRSFLQLNGTYTIFFRAKGGGGSNQLNVSVGRFTTAHGNVSYFNKNITLTSAWADYSYTFTADEDGTYIGTAYLSFTASGSKVLLDDASVTESATGSNTTPFRDAVVQRLQELNPGVLRYMDSGLDFGSTIDNMIAVPDARLRTGFGQGNNVSFDAPMGLEEFLQLCQAVGAEPWYTMPMGMSPTEAQNLIQFLAGDSSTPYGAKRAALGQTAPWTSVFTTIHLELGDEAWNSAFSGDTIDNAYAYGTRVGVIFGAARASASYDSSKFDLIMDGWASNWWWGQQAMNYASNTYDTIDAAPYTFDTFTSYANNEAIYGSMFAEPEAQDSRSTGEMYEQMGMVTGKTGGLTGKTANLATYEVNLGTTSGTAPQSVINEVIPSLGAGLSTAEHLLLMMRDDGVNLQTMFALPEYTNGYSNNNGGGGIVQLWGTVIDMGGETNLCRPQFLAEELANTAVGPTMLAAAQSGANPTWDEDSPNDTYNPINITGAHYIQSFAFVNGTENSLILFNLSRTSELPVTFTGVNAPTGTVQVGLLTSANLTDTNETTSKVAIANSTIENFNPAATTNLPPYSMTVYRWTPGGGITPPQPKATTTSLGASPTSITVGQTVALTATVGASSGTPSGSVVFSDGGTTLGTGTLSAGQTTLDVSTLTVGSHTLTAAFQGNSAFGNSTSSSVTVTVSAAASSPVATTTAVTVPANVTVGKSATFSATVTAGSGSTPTGTIYFKTGTTVLGITTLTGGKASYTVSSVSLAPGTYNVVAFYQGDSTDSASVSPGSPLQVNSAATATTTTLSLPATKMTERQSVTATATVKAASGSTPTGRVDFYVGTLAVGTGQLSGGVAKFTTNVDLTPGSYKGIATYLGTSADSTSTSAAIDFTVVADTVATVTSLTSNTTQTVEGNQVVLTASVSPQAQGVTATGAVTVYLGQTVLGTGQLAGGQAVLNITTQFAPGNYQLTAAYAGNGTDQGSTSNPLTLTITPDLVATSIQLTASPTQLTSGESSSLVAKVSPAAGGVTQMPIGLVSFYLGQTKIGSATLVGAVANFTYVANMPPGTYKLTATYAGNTIDSASSSTPVTIIISPSVVATTTSLTSSASQLTQGQSFSLAASVVPSSGSTAPQGTVTFYLGQTQIGTATLSGGKATLTDTGNIAPGTYQLTAVYTGNAQDSSSTSNPVTITIAPSVVATTTTLTASAAQLTPGQSFSLTAVVAPGSGSGTPQGTVSFYLGQTKIGSAVLAAGSATVTDSSSLAPGTYQLTAVYAGNAQDSASTSNPVTLTVAAPSAIATTTTLTSSAAQVTSGQSLSLTAVVTAGSGSGTPQGTVSFYLGTTQIGSATLTGGTATLAETNLAPGSYQLTAVYAGNSTDSGSTSNPVALVVAAATPPQPLATSTGVSINPQQPVTGQTMTLQVQVTATGAATPIAGNVTFYLGQTAIGAATVSAGSASLSLPAPQPGTYTVTAAFAGQGQFAASQSTPLSFTVQAAAATVPPAPPTPPAPGSFTLGLSSNAVTLGKAQTTASLQVMVAAVQGYKGGVQLSCGGLPAGVSCSFSPAELTINGAQAASTLSFSSQINNACTPPMITNVAQGILLPWDIIGVLGFISGRKRLRGRWSAFMTICLALLCSTIWMTGCGLTINNITEPYQVTVTAVGQDQITQTTTLTLYVSEPAGTF